MKSGPNYELQWGSFLAKCTWPNVLKNTRSVGCPRQKLLHIISTRNSIRLIFRDENTFNTLPSKWAAVVDKWSLQWRHNDRDSVSNHQPHGCLFNRLFGRRSKKTSKLRVTGLCVGNSPGRWIPRTKGQLRWKCFHLIIIMDPCR